MHSRAKSIMLPSSQLINGSAQILAHHADFPSAEELAAEGPSLLEPFQTMLQFAFEALLAPLPACKQPAGEALAKKQWAKGSSSLPHGHAPAAAACCDTERWYSPGLTKGRKSHAAPARYLSDFGPAAETHMPW